MPTIDDRVALLERQVSEILPLRDAVSHLEHRMDAGFQAIDRRFESVDRRFEAIDRRIDGLDDKMSRQFETMHDRMSRQFMWLVGIQVTTLAAIVAAVVGALVSLAPR